MGVDKGVYWNRPCIYQNVFWQKNSSSKLLLLLYFLYLAFLSQKHMHIQDNRGREGTIFNPPYYSQPLPKIQTFICNFCMRDDYFVFLIECI